MIGGVTLARRRLCETKPEKLKLEARRAKSGDAVAGQGSRGGVASPSPPAKGLGECCKLAQWGTGRSYGKMWFWCISGLEKSSNLDISRLVGRFLLLAFCTKFHLTIVGGP